MEVPGNGDVEVDAGTNFQDIKVAVFKLGLETDEYRNGGQIVYSHSTDIPRVPGNRYLDVGRCSFKFASRANNDILPSFFLICTHEYLKMESRHHSK
jgi:hypothetical protein